MHLDSSHLMLPLPAAGVDVKKDIDHPSCMHQGSVAYIHKHEYLHFTVFIAF